MNAPVGEPESSHQTPRSPSNVWYHTPIRLVPNLLGADHATSKRAANLLFVALLASDPSIGTVCRSSLLRPHAWHGNAPHIEIREYVPLSAVRNQDGNSRKTAE